MKYAVFAFASNEYNTRNPGGGWWDFVIASETLEDAKNIIPGKNTSDLDDDGHIVDLTALAIIMKWNNETGKWETA